MNGLQTTNERQWGRQVPDFAKGNNFPNFTLWIHKITGSLIVIIQTSHDRFGLVLRRRINSLPGSFLIGNILMQATFRLTVIRQETALSLRVPGPCHGRILCERPTIKGIVFIFNERFAWGACGCVFNTSEQRYTSVLRASWWCKICCYLR